MTTCTRCQTDFDVASARTDYEAEFDSELDYDEDFGGEVCAPCGIAQSTSLIDRGRAIMMVNGDDDYDDDFVQAHL